MDIVEKVKAAGVVGAGGAGFPTHVKLSAKVDIFLVNAAECEPLLRTDQQLIPEQAELFVEGMARAMEATQAATGIVAIKAKYRPAIRQLEKKIAKNMQIVLIPDVYPAGDEIVTIWLATGRVVPAGGLPFQSGVVVNNPQTVINIANACQDRPVTTRTLTITGHVKRPLTVTVPLGLPYSELLAFAGGATTAKPAYIDGGPVMGGVFFDINRFVKKTSGGLVVLPANHPLIAVKTKDIRNTMMQARAVCEQCMYCTELCPRHNLGHGLHPHLNVRALNYPKLVDPQKLLGALLCSECGVCDYYACPVGISPRRINIALKQELRECGVKYSGSDQVVDKLVTEKIIPSKRMAQRLGIADIYYLEAPLEKYSPLVSSVTLSLSQHIGAPAEPLVAVGDRVNAGQLIAAIPDGKLAANIHAALTGLVSAVDATAITIEK